MFSHATVGTNDLAAVRPFWLAVMDVLGHPVLFDNHRSLAFGTPAGPKTFILPPFDGGSARAANGMHLAYIVPTRTQVDAFHAAALAHGGSDEGAPRLRPHYHPNYYGAYVRDPDGNKLQAVCHSAKG